MALIKCPECGREVSDTCSHCIHCGFALKTRKKNIFTYFLYLLKINRFYLVSLICFLISLIILVCSPSPCSVKSGVLTGETTDSEYVAPMGTYKWVYHYKLYVEEDLLNLEIQEDIYFNYKIGDTPMLSNTFKDKHEYIVLKNGDIKSANYTFTRGTWNYNLKDFVGSSVAYYYNSKINGYVEPKLSEGFTFENPQRITFRVITLAITALTGVTFISALLYCLNTYPYKIYKCSNSSEILKG